MYSVYRIHKNEATFDLYKSHLFNKRTTKNIDPTCFGGLNVNELYEASILRSVGIQVICL